MLKKFHNRKLLFSNNTDDQFSDDVVHISKVNKICPPSCSPSLTTRSYHPLAALSSGNSPNSPFVLNELRTAEIKISSSLSFDHLDYITLKSLSNSTKF